MFYTALYHALLAPTLYSDADGEYLGMDDVVHQSGAQPVYGTYSVWDLYRTQWPLLAMLDPHRARHLTHPLFRNAQHTLPSSHLLVVLSFFFPFFFLFSLFFFFFFF